MGRSARRDFQKAYIDFATAMLDDRPSKKWREKLREEARDEWRDLDRGDRKAALAVFEDLADLADARGGAAIEAAGEDMARLILWSLNPTPAMEASAIYRVIDREDPLWSWNEEANLELTIGDVAAMLALMDAKARDKRFDVDRFDRQNFDLVEEAGYVVADYFRNADVDEALMLSSFSVYAEGLEAHWEDMSRKERRDALGLMEGDAPKRSNMKEFLDAGDPFGPMRKAMNSVDWDDDGGKGGGLDRGDFANRYVKLAQEIVGEKLTKSERRDLREEARDKWRDYDAEERSAGYERMGDRLKVADADGGRAIEARGPGRHPQRPDPHLRRRRQGLRAGARKSTTRSSPGTTRSTLRSRKPMSRRSRRFGARSRATRNSTPMTFTASSSSSISRINARASPTTARDRAFELSFTSTYAAGLGEGMGRSQPLGAALCGRLRVGAGDTGSSDPDLMNKIIGADSFRAAPGRRPGPRRAGRVSPPRDREHRRWGQPFRRRELRRQLPGDPAGPERLLEPGAGLHGLLRISAGRRGGDGEAGHSAELRRAPGDPHGRAAPRRRGWR